MNIHLIDLGLYAFLVILVFWLVNGILRLPTWMKALLNILIVVVVIGWTVDRIGYKLGQAIALRIR